jgi:hypothetical protein
MRQKRERGSSLIVVILVMAFMLAVGVAILTVSATAPKVSGSVRDQEEAFNTAEAGFEAARMAIEGFFLNGVWTNLQDNVLRIPTGIDLPLDAAYFRRRTDADVVQALSVTSPGVVFLDQAFVRRADGSLDPSRTYTVFLIDDEAGSGTPDPADVLMVCIGVVRAGNRILSTSRLEILLGVESPGTNP